MEGGECWEAVEHYRTELIAQARSILSNQEDAEDVVQETFCEAVRHPERIANARSLGAWLRAVNRCNALNRARGRRHDSARIVGRQKQAPEKTFTTGGFSILELRDTLLQALGTLPETLRAAVRLRYYDHKSCKEISSQLGIPARDVSRMLLDATMRMYAKLEKQLEHGAGLGADEAGSVPDPASQSALLEDDPTQQIEEHSK